jgi:hypothetical protein
MVYILRRLNQEEEGAYIMEIRLDPTSQRSWNICRYVAHGHIAVYHRTVSRIHATITCQPKADEPGAFTWKITRTGGKNGVRIESGGQKFACLEYNASSPFAPGDIIKLSTVVHLRLDAEVAL